MVYYALGVLSPNYFYLSACTICLLVALSIGSSWTVVAMIGVGLMGVADRTVAAGPASAAQPKS